MAYQSVPLNIAGPSYVSRSLRLSAQKTQNFYQEINLGAKSTNAHQPFPGLKLLGNGGTTFRGATVMAGVAYKVTGTSLFRVQSNGQHTLLGEVPGSAMCIFANDGMNLFIVTGSTVYQWNGVSVTTVADTDIQGATAVDYQNRQFIYTKDDFFVISDVGNGASASSLNAAQAESQPDSLNRAYVFKDTVFMVGSDTTEPWYNSGAGSPPYDKITGQVVGVGSNAIHSLAQTENFMYFLGDDAMVYRAVQGIFEPVSSVAVVNAIESYQFRDDAIGFCFAFQGMNFYMLSFPAEGKTWLLNELLAQDGWTELASGTEQGVYRCYGGVRCYGKNLFFDRANGNVYQLDVNTYTENGDAIQRIRTLPAIHSGLLGNPGKRLQMKSMVFEVETGVGLITGQGDNPRMMIELSIDGGATFQPASWVRVGRQGEKYLQVKCDKMLVFYDLVVRITTSDPVFFSLHSASIDLRYAGW